MPPRSEDQVVTDLIGYHSRQVSAHMSPAVSIYIRFQILYLLKIPLKGGIAKCLTDSMLKKNVFGV